MVQLGPPFGGLFYAWAMALGVMRGMTEWVNPG
jgi:hypothetical protein